MFIQSSWYVDYSNNFCSALFFFLSTNCSFLLYLSGVVVDVWHCGTICNNYLWVESNSLCRYPSAPCFTKRSFDKRWKIAALPEFISSFFIYGLFKLFQCWQSSFLTVGFFASCNELLIPDGVLILVVKGKVSNIWRYWREVTVLLWPLPYTWEAQRNIL